MNISAIKTIMKDHKPSPMGVNKEYSVLIPIVEIDGKLEILYERRAKNLRVQPGEISFPGGRVEKEETYMQAAIRETVEELNIKEEDIEIIGAMDYIVMPFNMVIRPFIGLITDVDIFNIKYNKAEVDSLFSVPIDFFIKNHPRCHNMKLKPKLDEDFPYHLIQDGTSYKWRTGKYPIYFYEYEEDIIWGLTARITKRFIEIITGE